MTLVRYLIALFCFCLAIGCAPRDAVVDSHDGHDHASSTEAPPASASEEGPSLSPENDPQIKEIVAKSGAIIYPGATIPDGRSNIRKGTGQVRYELVMYSNDKPDKIGQFYHDKMKLSMEEKRAGLTLVGMVNEKIPVIIVIYEDAGHSVIQYAGLAVDPAAKPS